MNDFEWDVRNWDYRVVNAVRITGRVAVAVACLIWAFSSKPENLYAYIFKSALVYVAVSLWGSMSNLRATFKTMEQVYRNNTGHFEAVATSMEYIKYKDMLSTDEPQPNRTMPPMNDDELKGSVEALMNALKKEYVQYTGYEEEPKLSVEWSSAGETFKLNVKAPFHERWIYIYAPEGDAMNLSKWGQFLKALPGGWYIARKG